MPDENGIMTEEEIQKWRNTFVIKKWQLKRLPEVFNEICKGTPFEGSKLVYTGRWSKKWISYYGERHSASYEFELFPSVQSYEPIPGYRFAGFTKTVAEDNWTVHRIDPDFEFTKEIVDQLDPLRCDVCGHRRLRKRLFILLEKKTNKLVIVGGSCAKKFKGINLDDLLRKVTKVVTTIVGMLDDFDGCGWGRTRFVESLSVRIAQSEAIIRKLGYTSKKESDINENLIPTAFWLHLPYIPIGNYRGEDPLKEKRKILAEIYSVQHDYINERATELFESEFKQLIDYFSEINKNKWKEFAHNCLSYLNSVEPPDGIVAYFGSVRFRIEENLEKEKERKRKKQQEQTTGFDGPIGKMFDFGIFKVRKVKYRENAYGYQLGFTCVNHKNEKLWFQVGENSVAGEMWEKIVGHNDVTSYEIEIRGKLREVKEDISFGTMIKFKNIFKKGEKVDVK